MRVALLASLTLVLAGVAALPTASAIPPVCIEKEVRQGAVTAGYSSCYDEYVIVDNCSSGSAQRIHFFKDVGPAYVRVDACLPHSPPPASQQAGADLPDLCGPTAFCTGPDCSGVKDYVEGGIDIDVGRTCTVQVSIDLMDCLWGEHWVTYEAGPVTVRYTTCSPPYEVA